MQPSLVLTWYFCPLTPLLKGVELEPVRRPIYVGLKLHATGGAAAAQGHTIVVEKSTLPVTNGRGCTDYLERSKWRESFSVLSNPEFLAEGTAISI